MAFQNNGFNQQNQQNQSSATGDKPRTNFPIGVSVRGTDGRMDVSAWKSTSAVFTILQIKQMIGKDPATGQPVFENKKPNELPRIFLNPEMLKALVMSMEGADMNQVNINVTQSIVNKNNTNKLTMTGTNNQIKITIESPTNGTRTITLDGIPTGTITVNPNWTILIDMLKIAYKKALTARLDPSEFAFAVSGDDNSEESPF